MGKPYYQDDLVERAARAAYEAVVAEAAHKERWEKLPEWWRSTFRKQATAILAVVETRERSAQQAFDFGEAS